MFFNFGTYHNMIKVLKKNNLNNWLLKEWNYKNNYNKHNTNFLFKTAMMRKVKQPNIYQNP